MADQPAIRIHFVPYQAQHCGTVRSKKDDHSISLQQHAAREYHRKAKLHRAPVKFPRRATTSVDNTQAKAQQHLTLKRNNSDPPPTALYRLLGAGRLDPLNTYCAELPMHAHEMLDHALSYQWSVFTTSGQQDAISAVRHDVASSAMTRAVSLFTVIFAGASHLAYMRKHDGDKVNNTEMRLSFKTQAIRALAEDIRQNNGQVSDEVLLAMITLAAHGSGESPTGAVPDHRHDRKTASKAYYVGHYSGLETGWAHLRMVYVLLEQRGGLQTIKLQGLAGAIQLYDLLASLRILQPPKIPLLQPTEHAMKSRTHRADATAVSLTKVLCSALLPLLHSDNLPEMASLHRTIKHIRDITVDLDQFVRKSSDLQPIHWLRSLAVHDLLSLPQLSPATLNATRGTAFTHAGMIYAITHHTAFAFIQLTFWPFRLPTRQANTVASPLLALLHLYTTIIPASEIDTSFLLWSTLLGGMCAYEDYDFTHDSSLLEKYAKLLEKTSIKLETRAWATVRSVVERYLWFERDCAGIAEEFWMWACRRTREGGCRS